jgi:hypothetical protein
VCPFAQEEQLCSEVMQVFMHSIVCPLSVVTVVSSSQTNLCTYINREYITPVKVFGTLH